MELFAGFEEQLPYFSDNYGLELILFNRSYHKSSFSYLPSIPIRTGMQTIIEVSRRFETFLPYPYSACKLDLRHADINTIDSNFYRETYNKKINYRQVDCYQRAFILTVAKKCQCLISKSYENLTLNYPACYTTNSSKCVQQVHDDDWKTRNFDGEYEKECPFQCDYFRFKRSILYRNFPSLNYAIKLQKEVNDYLNSSSGRQSTVEDVKRSIASLRIGYKLTSLGYYGKSEYATISVISLVSNIGGTLGLFLGMSFLSILEFLEAFYLTLIPLLELFKIKIFF